MCLRLHQLAMLTQTFVRLEVVSDNHQFFEKAVRLRYGLFNYIRNVITLEVAKGVPLIRSIMLESPKE